MRFGAMTWGMFSQRRKGAGAMLRAMTDFFNTEDTEIDTEDTKGITSFFTARVAKDYATYAMVCFCALYENSVSFAVKKGRRQICQC